MNYPEYPKINSLFMRDSKTKKFTNEFAEEEFSIIQNWDVFEKIDGTNIRIFYIPKTDDKEAFIHINGRTNNAQVPVLLYETILKKFPVEIFIEKFGDTSVTLFGEGVGGNIQSGLYGPDYDIVLFDIRIGNFWLKYDDVRGIADCFNVPVVEKIESHEINSINQIQDFVQTKPFSFFGKIRGADCISEGVVCKASLGLLNRSGKRIIFKLKVKDFMR